MDKFGQLCLVGAGAIIAVLGLLFLVLVLIPTAVRHHHTKYAARRAVRNANHHRRSQQ